MSRKRTLVILAEIEVLVDEDQPMAAHLADEWLRWELRTPNAPGTGNLEVDPGVIQAQSIRVFDMRAR